MKKLFTALLFVLISTSFIQAQVRTEETKTSVDKKTGDTTVVQSTIVSTSEDITPRNHMFVVNPLKFFLLYNLCYFAAVSDNIAIGGGFQIPTPSGVSGFGINFEARIYPSGKSLKGFYVAPNFSYNSLKYEENGEEETMNPFSAGLLIGWQWFPGDEFAIGLGLGVDYYTGETESAGNIEKFSGTVPAIRFDIGYAF